MKGRKYSKKNILIVDDVDRYRLEWIGWWTASQPKWWSTQLWPFPKDGEGDGSWEGFPARGKDGIFLAIMATCWWAQAVVSAEDFILFEEAVDDVHWVVQELIRITSLQSASDELQQTASATDEPQQTTSASNNPQPASTTSDGPQPAPPASWTCTFSRVDGKRAVRPSQRARDIIGLK